MTSTAKFSDADHTAIAATIDGVMMSIPADPANRHYRLLTDGDDALGIAPTVIANYETPPVSAGDVKAEAGRRILARYPDWYQRNMIAEGLTLTEIGAANRTPEQNARVTELNAIWAWVADVRAASNVLEAMVPVPADYGDDAHWPQVLP